MPEAETVPNDVATGRDTHVLLTAVGAPRLTPEAAVDQGLIVRQKVEGLWIYAAEDELIEQALEEMAEHCVAAAHDLFIGHLKQVAGRARKRVTCDLHAQAAQQLLKLHLRRGVLGALGQLNQHYDPYLVIYAADEQDEVDRVLAQSIDTLLEQGSLELEEVQATLTLRQSEEWREVVLRHLEFLGHGWLAYGRLVGTGE